MTDEPPVTTPVTLDRRSGLEGPRAEEEVHQHRSYTAAFGFDPQDGLPRPVAEASASDAYIPPLDPATFVCMADMSAFVLRDDAGTELARFTPAEVERSADGRYRVGVQAIEARLRAMPLPALLQCARQRWAMELLRTEYVSVEPLRPACKHYVRMMTDFADNRGHRFLSRMCAAIRSETGEYMSLRDAEMYACELRDPRDAATEAQLEQFDQTKVELGRARVPEEFDVENALRAERRATERQEVETQGGIFGP